MAGRQVDHGVVDPHEEVGWDLGQPSRENEFGQLLRLCGGTPDREQLATDAVG